MGRGGRREWQGGVPLRVSWEGLGATGLEAGLAAPSKIVFVIVDVINTIIVIIIIIIVIIIIIIIIIYIRSEAGI